MLGDQPQGSDQTTQASTSDQQVAPPTASQSASLDKSEIQPDQPQVSTEPQAPETPSSVISPQPPQEESWPNSTKLAIPQLQLPFNGNYPISFAFGEQPTDEAIKNKFREWGIIGHHGIDYQLPEGTEVIAVSDGKVIQAGENGDFGISVTIQHSWGTSLYAHLKETKVSQDQEVKAGDIIGLSDQIGSAFGPHLHFGIKSNNPDQNNGYLGFIDPSPYLLSVEVQKEEAKLQDQPQVSSSQPQSPQIPQSPEPSQTQTQDAPKQAEQQPQSQSQSQPQVIEKVVEKEIVTEVPVEVIKEVIKEVPVVNEEEVQKQVEEKLKTMLDEKRQKANEARKQRKSDNLQEIMEFAKVKREITNEDIQKLLHVSQSTATNYLTELVNQGLLKKQGERGGTKYIY